MAARLLRSASRGLSIAEVSRRSGIPASTLRFYEREMPALFLIRKTPGGHRRYGEKDVSRFETIRRLTQEGLALAEIRRVLSSSGDHEPLTEEVARLRAAQQEEGWAVAELSRRVAFLEAKLKKLSEKRRWFEKK